MSARDRLVRWRIGGIVRSKMTEGATFIMRVPRESVVGTVWAAVAPWLTATYRVVTGGACAADGARVASSSGW